MKKKIVIIPILIILLLPNVAYASFEIPFEGPLFHNYDINLSKNVHEYYVIVENNIDKLSIATENKCAEDELCIDDHLFNYFLQYSDEFVLNGKEVVEIGELLPPDNYDEVEYNVEVNETKDCDVYKIDGKTRMLFCDIYDNEEKDNYLYKERTIFDENEEIVGYIKSVDEYEDSHYLLGSLNVGENILTFNSEDSDTYIIHITRKEKEEVVPKEEIKEDNNIIKEDENIKESPNTGSTINIVIGLFLLISFSVLLYLDRKHKQVK